MEIILGAHCSEAFIGRGSAHVMYQHIGDVHQKSQAASSVAPRGKPFGWRKRPPSFPALQELVWPESRQVRAGAR
jgi:hypothetical protein